MYAVDCPECGQDGVVDLTLPDRFECDACGYVGAPSPKAAEDLLRAAAEIRNRNVRQRQLSDQEQRLAVSIPHAMRRYLVGFLGLAVPLGGCLAFQAFEGRILSFNDGLLVFVPFFLSASIGIAGYFLLRSRLTKARAAVLAAPSVRENVRCHFCGGELGKASDGNFVRCLGCGADNLLDANAVTRKSDSPESSMSALARVRAHAETHRRAIRGARRALSSVVFSAVVGSCLVIGPLMWVLVKNELPPNDDLEYTVVDTETQGPCIAIVQRRSMYEDCFIIGNWLGVYGLTSTRDCAEVPTFHHPALVGLEVRRPLRQEPDMVIGSVHGLGARDNRVHMVGEDGQTRNDLPNVLCLVDVTTSPVEPIPLEAEPQ